MSNQLDADGEQRSQRISEEATVESKNYLLRVTAIALAILPGLSASLAVGCGIGYWLRSADSALQSQWRLSSGMAGSSTPARS